MAYFIKIEDGPELRRKLLESSKASLHILKGYQELLRVRGEKLTQMNNLRREMKEVTVLLNRIENDMPILTEREIAEFNPQMKDPMERPQQKQLKIEQKKGSKTSNTVYLSMPKKETVVEVPVPKPKLTPQAPAPEKPVARMTELERLEAQLERINSKLGQL